MSDQRIDLNTGFADCIKSTSHLGETVYTNICTGAHASVPWGAVDWLGMAAVAGFVIALMVVFGSVAVAVSRS